MKVQSKCLGCRPGDVVYLQTEEGAWVAACPCGKRGPAAADAIQAGKAWRRMVGLPVRTRTQDALRIVAALLAGATVISLVLWLSGGWTLVAPALLGPATEGHILALHGLGVFAVVMLSVILGWLEKAVGAQPDEYSDDVV